MITINKVFEIPSELEENYLQVDVGGYSVLIKKEETGVVVDIYHPSEEEPVAGTWVHDHKVSEENDSSQS